MLIGARSWTAKVRQYAHEVAGEDDILDPEDWEHTEDCMEKCERRGDFQTWMDNMVYALWTAYKEGMTPREGWEQLCQELTGGEDRAE